MNFNWFESFLLGIISGLTEILPVSVDAHRKLLIKVLGNGNPDELMALMIHLGAFLGVYFSCQTHILKISRAIKLSRVPKKKRKRPLDVRSLMDLRLLQTMLVPVVLVLFFYQQINGYTNNMILMATFLFANGLILYIPQFLPSSNKDCRTLSRVEGLLMGLGGALFALPGMSGVGVALSAASVTGVDRKYGLSMVLLMELGVLAGKIVYDILALIGAGVGGISIILLLRYILSGIAAFTGTWFAVKIMRNLAAENGFTVFSYYCWAIALFTFVLSLMA